MNVGTTVLSPVVRRRKPPHIPESVLAYETDCAPDASWRTEGMIPSVGSSGYHSSSSPRSTSTPSPTSLQESQDRYAGSPVEVHAQHSWHGLSSEVYNGDDVAFHSGLLAGLDLDPSVTADVETRPAPRTTGVCHTTPCYDGAALGAPTSEAPALSLSGVPTNVPQSGRDTAAVGSTAAAERKCGAAGSSERVPTRRIQPKPSTTSRSAALRMTERLDSDRKGKIWAKISTITDEDIVKGDEDGDT